MTDPANIFDSSPEAGNPRIIIDEMGLLWLRGEEATRLRQTLLISPSFHSGMACNGLSGSFIEHFHDRRFPDVILRRITRLGEVYWDIVAANVAAEVGK